MKELVTLDPQLMNGGGYYTILNVREQDSQSCFDIYMLTEEIEDKDMADQMKTLNDISHEMMTSITKSVKKVTKD